MFEAYTATELADKLECSEVTARKRARKKGFESISKIVKGKEVEAFKITYEHLQELIQEVKQNKQIYTKEQQILNEKLENIIEVLPNESETFHNKFSQDIQAESIKIFVDKLSELEEKAFQYAEQAGQTKYLEDKSSQLNKDVQHWQEQYFKLKYENESLTKVNNEQSEKIGKLESELTALKSQQQQQKKSGFMGLFRK